MQNKNQKLIIGIVSISLASSIFFVFANAGFSSLLPRKVSTTNTNQVQTDTNLPQTTESSSFTNLIPDKTIIINDKSQETPNVIQNDQATVSVQDPKAETVDLYITPKDSVQETYLGTAQKTEMGWTYNIDVKDRLPNGDYDVTAKATTQEGVYKVGEVPLQVKVPVMPSTIPLSNASLSQKDSDQDGLSDAEEIRIGTNPAAPDTDRDGFLDGDEIKNGSDPLLAGTKQNDKIVFQNPKEKGVIDRKFVVDNVEMVKSETKKTLNIKGKAIPNTFIRIYIFSDPIIITVKTDSQGNWSYDLEKEIEDGQHQVYIGITDNKGIITAKSEPITFVKTAEAATVIPTAQAEELRQNLSPVDKSKANIASIAGLIVIIFLSVALALIGIVAHSYSDERSY